MVGGAFPGFFSLLPTVPSYVRVRARAHMYIAGRGSTCMGRCVPLDVCISRTGMRSFSLPLSLPLFVRGVFSLPCARALHLSASIYWSLGPDLRCVRVALNPDARSLDPTPCGGTDFESFAPGTMTISLGASTPWVLATLPRSVSQWLRKKHTTTFRRHYRSTGWACSCRPCSSAPSQDQPFGSRT